ncbi:MAG: hypothetical protein L0271_15990 [Gemmatimonadetes bacterium]|nr:hypothetical protein [Gemmatimonadota bacterium]
MKTGASAERRRDIVYLDTSVVLAQLFAEDRRPPAELWTSTLVSSRLLEFEVWTRVHVRGLGASQGEHVRAVLDRIAFLEPLPEVVTRIAEPAGMPLRTLDACTVAAIEFLRSQRMPERAAAYDGRLLAALHAPGIPTYPL